MTAGQRANFYKEVGMMIDRVDTVILAGGGEIEPGTGVKGMLTIGSRMIIGVYDGSPLWQ